MGRFIDSFIASGPARSAYSKGVELFGFAPVDELIVDPGNVLPLEIRTAVEQVLGTLDKATHPERSVLIGVVKTRFNDTGLRQELATVRSKIASMFAPGTDFSREGPPLMRAIEDLCTEVRKVPQAIEAAGARYVQMIQATRQQELAAAKGKVANLRSDVDAGILRFNTAGRNVSMATAVTTEHQAVYFKDPETMTWAKFALADAAERLYQIGGDLPKDLQLRSSDDDLSAFLAYASTGISKVAPGQGQDDPLTAFTNGLSRFESARTSPDANASTIAMSEMAHRLNELGGAIGQMVSSKDPALDSAVELSMVLTETVRGVLDMECRGFQTSRADEAKLDPQQYQRDSSQAFAVRRTLAHQGANEMRKEESTRARNENDRHSYD